MDVLTKLEEIKLEVAAKVSAQRLAEGIQNAGYAGGDGTYGRTAGLQFSTPTGQLMSKKLCTLRSTSGVPGFQRR